MDEIRRLSCDSATEALTVIDVNTGKCIAGKKDDEVI